MFHSTFDRMPVTHARQITGRYGHGHDPITDDDWVAYGGFREDLPRIRSEANAILDSVTDEQEALLTKASSAAPACRSRTAIRDQALS